MTDVGARMDEIIRAFRRGCAVTALDVPAGDRRVESDLTVVEADDALIWCHTRILAPRLAAAGLEDVEPEYGEGFAEFSVEGDDRRFRLTVPVDVSDVGEMTFRRSHVISLEVAE